MLLDDEAAAGDLADWIAAENAEGNPDGAIMGVVVVQPDGSAAVGWLEAHPAAAKLTDARKRALVTLSVTHARDMDLQTTIQSDDDRLMEAIRATDQGSQSHTSSNPGQGSTPHARGIVAGQDAAGTSTQSSPSSAHVSSTDAGSAEPLPGWLVRMNMRDQELQQRIAATDMAMHATTG